MEKKLVKGVRESKVHGDMEVREVAEGIRVG